MSPVSLISLLVSADVSLSPPDDAGMLSSETSENSGAQEEDSAADSKSPDASDASDTPAGFVPHAQNASSAANSTRTDRINSLVRMILPPFPYGLR